MNFVQITKMIILIIFDGELTIFEKKGMNTNVIWNVLQS